MDIDIIGGMMIKVKDMSMEDFDDLCGARQEWGNKKYGDADKFRDWARDVTEEIADVINITQRRIGWLDKSDIKFPKKELTVKSLFEVQVKAINILDFIKFSDKLIKESGYVETDEVERIWFKKEVE